MSFIVFVFVLEPILPYLVTKLILLPTHSQAVLINLILRNYLAVNQFSLADKFRLNVNFPDHRSNYQHARYLYYIGRINLVQLDYSGAFAHLTEALRKAPTHAAIGFRQSVRCPRIF
jgi:26S proteasome regulatory subunit N3